MTFFIEKYLKLNLFLLKKFLRQTKKNVLLMDSMDEFN